MIVGIAVVLATLACGIEQDGFGTEKSPRQFFARLDVDHHAVNLAMTSPYNTVQLQVVAEMGDGSAAPGTPTFTVQDSAAVSVSATGLLTAIEPIEKTVVRISMTLDGVTRTDSVAVSVIAGSPPSLLNELAIVPQPNDSAKVNVGGNLGGGSKTLTLLRLNTDRDTLSSVLVSLRSSDSLTAVMSLSGNDIYVTAKRPGHAMLYVSTYAYGVEKRDSLPFTVGWPLGVFVSTWDRIATGTNVSILDFNPRSLTVGVGACVIWWNGEVDGRAIDIVFDDPSVASEADGMCATLSVLPAAPGNIPAFAPTLGPSGNPEFGTQFASRMFLKPGKHHYRSTLYGTEGVIHVCDEHEDRSCAPQYLKW